MIGNIVGKAFHAYTNRDLGDVVQEIRSELRHEVNYSRKTLRYSAKKLAIAAVLGAVALFLLFIVLVLALVSIVSYIAEQSTSIGLAGASLIMTVVLLAILGAVAAFAYSQVKRLTTAVSDYRTHWRNRPSIRVVAAQETTGAPATVRRSVIANPKAAALGAFALAFALNGGSRFKLGKALSVYNVLSQFRQLRNFNNSRSR